MHYAIVNHDKPNSLDLRMSTRETHLAYLRSTGDALMTAGAILADDGATPIGSIVIIEVETLDDARAFAAADPYAEAGLFSSSVVTAWRKAFPEN